MTIPKLRLSIMLEVLSICIMFAGFAMVHSSCKTIKDTVVTTTTDSHTETVDSDTAYQQKSLTLHLTGDSSEVVGNSLRASIRDSVVVRDSINLVDSVVYRYRTVDLKQYKIDHPPVYTFTRYGHAKGWMTNNVLRVSMVVDDQVIQTKVDSAVQIITNTKTITDTHSEVIDTVRVETSFWDKVQKYVLFMFLFIVIVLIVMGLVKRYIKPWGKFWL